MKSSATIARVILQLFRDCRKGAVKFQRRRAVSETIAQALWDGVVEVQGSASDETLRYVVREDVLFS